MMSKTREHFEINGQGHVFTFFDELTEPEQENLLKQASDIDLEELSGLVSSLVQNTGSKNDSIVDSLEPAEFTPCQIAMAGIPHSGSRRGKRAKQLCGPDASPPSLLPVVREPASATTGPKEPSE